MKAISLWQPWATLLVCGVKKYETRSWATMHRGLLLIHASKTTKGLRMRLPVQLLQALEVLGYDSPTRPMPRGQIIGAVRLVKVRSTDYFIPGPLEAQFGNFSQGRWYWKCVEPQRLVHPIPFRGGQRLFDVPDEVLAGAKWEEVKP